MPGDSRHTRWLDEQDRYRDEEERGELKQRLEHSLGEAGAAGHQSKSWQRMLKKTSDNELLHGMKEQLSEGRMQLGALQDDVADIRKRWKVAQRKMEAEAIERAQAQRAIRLSEYAADMAASMPSSTSASRTPSMPMFANLKASHGTHGGTFVATPRAKQSSARLKPIAASPVSPAAMAVTPRDRGQQTNREQTMCMGLYGCRC